MKSYLRRRVERYSKSGKLVIPVRRDYEGIILIDLNINYKIGGTRRVKYIKRDSLVSTNYQADIQEEKTSDHHSFTLLRIIDQKDLDPKRWLPGTPLSTLPILKADHFTEEELIWAGKREGTIGYIIFLWGLTIGALWWSVLSLNEKYYFGGGILFLISLFFGRGAYSEELIFPRKPSTERLVELGDYKQKLISNEIKESKEANLSLKKALKSYATWARLTPQDFEGAIALKLKNENFMEVEVTKHSGDGGIDIEAEKGGREVIVQAKRYNSKVGVAVVREIAGVRETRGGNPQTIIFALSGFTRGAIALAKELNIELRSIRSELVQD